MAPSWAYGWRRRERVDGAVVGVWVAPSWAYMFRWRRLRRLDARVGASPVGKKGGAPWWALACTAGGASRLTENFVERADAAKGRHIPVGG